MTWTKTSDDFPDRLYDLSDAAYRLNHAAITFSNRLLLDGRIPKSRLVSVPTPQRCRTSRVIAELVSSGEWSDGGDAWELIGYFETQPTREEVEAGRGYDAIRQRLRFAKTPEEKAALRTEEEAAKERLNAAREERRRLASHRESRRESQRDSQRPVPPRPGPARPDRAEAEDKSEESSPGSGSAVADPGEPTNGQVDGETLRRIAEATGFKAKSEAAGLRVFTGAESAADVIARVKASDTTPAEATR